MKKKFLNPIARLLETGENVIATSGEAPAPGRTVSLENMTHKTLQSW